MIRGPESALFGAEASSAVIQIFTEHGDPEAASARTLATSADRSRRTIGPRRWTAGSRTGRLRLHADQFRTTGEFPNDAYRITTGTVNLGFRFSEQPAAPVFRTFDSYTGAPGQAFYGLDELDANETARDSALVSSG